MRDSFIFYRSFFEATKPLNKAQKASLFEAICLYSLDQETMELDPICTAMFSLIKPQLEANYNKFKAGKKSAEIKQKVNRQSTQKQQKVNKPITNVNDNVNDNVNVNVNKKDVYKSFDHLSITNEQVKKLIAIGYTNIEVDDIIESIKNYKKNKNYKSLYVTAKNWLKNDKLKNKKNENERASDFDKARAFGISL
mgnify:CR=1 FL=1|tara:strand:+ start:2127 stop:2711 length:585 start_codon:yes stop_codon:yes gene_type:complete